MRKFLPLYMLAIALAIALAAVGFGKVISPQTPSSQPKGIVWVHSLDEALDKAKVEKKPIMVDFFATWCAPCVYMEEKIYPAPEVIAASRDFISVKIDVSAQDPQSPEGEIAMRYNVLWLPTVLFLDENGNVLHVPNDETVGIPSKFAADMEKALKKFKSR